MTRLACLAALALSLTTGATGCTVKPTEKECRDAIANMQRLMGTENLGEDERVESEVRRCKGGSKKATVECAIKAQTLDDLRKCEFFKVPPGAKGLPTEPPGSAAGSAGSATGSDAAGAGSAAGSAAGSTAGSTAGSAAGSTATGTGSASGSAAPTGSAASPGATAGSAATGAGGGVGSAK